MASAEQVVRDFCAAAGEGSPEGMRAFFSDDVVYHNIPMDPAEGLEASMAFLEGFLGMCDTMTVDTRYLAVVGDVVLTERVDTLHMNGKAAPLPVMGTFELRDGKIAAWRDYFDMATITAMLSPD